MSADTFVLNLAASALGSHRRAVQFSILSREFDSGCEVERGAEAGVLDVVDA
jgi:hypothetical protein